MEDPKENGERRTTTAGCSDGGGAARGLLAGSLLAAGPHAPLADKLSGGVDGMVVRIFCPWVGWLPGSVPGAFGACGTNAKFGNSSPKTKDQYSENRFLGFAFADHAAFSRSPGVSFQITRCGEMSFPGRWPNLCNHGEITVVSRLPGGRTKFHLADHPVVGCAG